MKKSLFSILITISITMYLVGSSFGATNNGLEEPGGCGGSGGCGDAQLFYTGFENAGEDALVTTQPLGWNDDYTAVVLTGSESCLLTTPDTSPYNWKFDIAGDRSTALYYRMQFRIAAYADTSNSYEAAIYLENSVDTGIAGCRLTIDANTTKQLSATDPDGAVNCVPNPPDTGDFSTGTYYLYLVYNENSSVVCEVRDSNFDLISGWQASNTNNSGEVATAAGGYCNHNVDMIIDEIEVRTDTNWGTP